jgi:hypothetical protein
MIGLIGFLAWKLHRGERVAAFFPAWFLIALAPVLPLREHIYDYYLTVPLIGLAMWGGWALVSSWQARGAAKMIAVFLAAIYLCVSIPVARVTTVSFHDYSERVRTVVIGVVNLSRSEPGKMVLLKGVDAELFWSTIYHRPLRLFGINEVYVLPENLQPSGDAKRFFIDSATAREALDQGRAVIYDVRP